MRNDKIRRFRPRSNKYRSRRPGNGMKNNGAVQQINIHRNVVSRNGFAKNPHNLERIIEKYKNLAKEALSSGDKTLQENYLHSIPKCICNDIRYSLTFREHFDSSF